jgi:outer membrane protein assembly factor BamB
MTRMKGILSLLVTVAAMFSAEAQPALVPTWSPQLNNGISTPPSIGADGTVYVTSLGSPDALHALKPDGTALWTSPIVAESRTAIAIGPDGTLYFGNESVQLQAYRPDGTFKWEFVTHGNVSSSPAVGADGAVYVGSGDRNVYAINPDGTQRWSFTAGGPVGSPVVIDSDGTIYAGSTDRKLYALRLDGTKKWDFTTAGEVLNPPAIGSDGRLYLASSDGRIYALNRDGSRAWTNNTGSTLTSAVLGADNTIYVGRGQSLAAYSSDGKAKWAFDTGARIYGTPAIAGDGTIFVGNEAGGFYALDPAGTVVAVRAGTGVGINSSPAIGSDGTVYAGSADGKLFAFARTNGAPNSPWPMLGGRASRSGALPPSGPPQITIPPADLSVAPGSNAVLQVTVVGAAPLGYRWFRHDFPLTDVLNVSGAQTAQLHIDDTAPADSGEYMVAITNFAGGITSAPVRLNVLPGFIPAGTTLWAATPGGNIVSSPALSPDGTVYVTTSDGQDGTASSLQAYGADGSFRWKFPYGAPLWGSPLVAPGGVIYLGTMYPSNSLVALAPDGTKLWETPVGNSLQSRLALGADGTIYAAPSARGLVALAPDGTVRWSFLATNRVSVSPPSIAPDGTLYIATGHTDPTNGSPLGDLIALRPNGTEKWRFNGDRNKGFTEAAIAPDGKIVFGGSDKNGKPRIFALQTNGTLAWSSPGEALLPPAIAADGSIYVMGSKLMVFRPDGTTNQIIATSPSRNSGVALAADGTAHFSGFDGNLIGLTRSGRRFWTNFIGGDALSAPVLDAKGVLYIGAWDKLFAIQASGSIAMGGWPVYGHDASHSGNVTTVLPTVPLPVNPADAPGGFTFKLKGPLGGFLKVETSADLHNWTVVQTNRASETFQDATAGGNGRFYRVRPFYNP